MPSLDNNTKAFLELVRAGLWEKEARLSQFGRVDYNVVMRLAEEQSVVGLVAAGIDRLKESQEDGNAIPLEIKFQLIGQALQIEQRNLAMNRFISELVEKMCEKGIYTLLVKGQGIAQCYEKPLWRSSGDVDLLLSEDNYQKAKEYLVPLSSFQKVEGRYSKHLGLNIPDSLGNQSGIDQTEPWYVELHGTLRTGLATRIDELVDAVQRDVFFGGNVRSWQNDETTVFLPAPGNDAIFVFTHFLMHFYREDMTIRQVCDWARLLWAYRNKIDVRLLEKRLRGAGLMSEWKAFGALAVEYLGMPAEAMPLYYENDGSWTRQATEPSSTGLPQVSQNHNKAERLMKFLLKGYTGSKMRDTYQITKIFPYKLLRYLPSIFLNVNWLKIKERMFIK